MKLKPVIFSSHDTESRLLSDDRNKWTETKIDQIHNHQLDKSGAGLMEIVILSRREFKQSAFGIFEVARGGDAGLNANKAFHREAPPRAKILVSSNSLF